MVFNALEINGYVFSEEIGANAKKRFGRRKVNTPVTFFARFFWNKVNFTFASFEKNYQRSCT